jgi:hypothetical protein
MLLVLLERFLKARHKNLPHHRRPPHPRPPEQAKNLADNSRATKGAQMIRYRHEAWHVLSLSQFGYSLKLAGAGAVISLDEGERWISEAPWSTPSQPPFFLPL